MGKIKKSENVAIGKRLAEIQALYGKTDDYMCYVTGYTLHSYHCVCNGDYGLTLEKISRLANDEIFSREITYILTGKKARCDYSISGNRAYIEALKPEERKTYLVELLKIISDGLSK